MPKEIPTVIELKIGPVSEKFQLDFNICSNANCDCNGVNMVLYNKRIAIQFFLDFKTESYKEVNYSKDEISILTEFIAFLKSPKNVSLLNMEFFKKNYEYVKEKAKCKKNAISSYKLGHLISYKDIFWDNGTIEIKIDKNYIVFDSYCVTPNCSCTEVGLDFFEVFYSLGIRKPDFSFIYDYITGDYRDAVGIGEKKIRSIVSKSFINKKFKKRHEHLRKEVKKDVELKIKEMGLVQNKFKK
ncbi:MAG: hypothetical protein U9Q69_02185, partial [Nanoarchaeota archaeon]|nr:hypothetical protein [Nanoarchaeota archaeon]